ncbi:hypothetical protein JVX90_00210 [Gordonia sp. PDNC005]|uniref:hypothetical protein n=1 Tax=Gordonia sp. PDNC005 TaxID=2811424 RepID=UPI001965947B|nr:hypothetical protein [Gordonia sp. PDNC005]QRY62735.1 hypothetical protein JVX90_00210 [Gordonia sp. PDNC005]
MTTIVQVPAPESPPWITTWGPLLVASIAALAALLGVAITVSVARRTFTDEQSEKRRDRQRDLIARLVGILSHEISLWYLTDVATSQMTSSDMAEFVNTDTGKALGRLKSERTDVLIRARYEVLHPSLRTAIEAVNTAIEAKVNDDSAETSADVRMVLAARLNAGAKQLELTRVIELAVQAVEAAALTDLPVAIKPTEKPWWQFLR